MTAVSSERGPFATKGPRQCPAGESCGHNGRLAWPSAYPVTPGVVQEPLPHSKVSGQQATGQVAPEGISACLAHTLVINV